MAGLPDEEARFAYLAEGNAKRARKRVAADVLIRDQEGRILLVNPTYKEHWDLPGGMAESNESPRTAAEREVLEELGTAITTGQLLVLEWVDAHGPWDDQLLFIFDGGTLTEAAIVNLQVLDPEISEFALLTTEEAGQRLRPDIAVRLSRALKALADGSTEYVE